MKTQNREKNQTHQFLFPLGIALVTTLVVISAATAMHLLGPLATTTHAASLPSTCATTRGTQPALCEHQDPIVQGCVTDAQTLDIPTIFQDSQQTKPLGEVELRYSSTCNAYWVRTTAFVTRAGIFQAIHAILLFHDQTKDDIVGTPTTPSTLTPYVAWTDMTVAPLPPHAGSGQFDLVGQTQPITVALHE